MPSPTRRCMITDDVTDAKCLGHAPVDDPRSPPICDTHLDAIFGWLIRVKAGQLAAQLADQMLFERLATRPRWHGQRRGAPPAVAMLKPGQHLTDQDNAVLNFLRGAA